jgi:hypothetical protein
MSRKGNREYEQADLLPPALKFIFWGVKFRADFSSETPFTSLLFSCVIKWKKENKKKSLCCSYVLPFVRFITLHRWSGWAVKVCQQQKVALSMILPNVVPCISPHKNIWRCTKFVWQRFFNWVLFLNSNKK